MEGVRRRGRKSRRKVRREEEAEEEEDCGGGCRREGGRWRSAAVGRGQSVHRVLPGKWMVAVVTALVLMLVGTGRGQKTTEGVTEFVVREPGTLIPKAMAFCPISGNIVVAGDVSNGLVFVLKVGQESMEVEWVWADGIPSGENSLGSIVCGLSGRFPNYARDQPHAQPGRKKDTLMIQLQKSGDVAQILQNGSSEDDEIRAMTTVANGNLYFTGYMNSQLFPGTVHGAFVVRTPSRLDSTEVFLLSLSVGSSTRDFGVGIDSDGSFIDLLSVETPEEGSGRRTVSYLTRISEPNFAVGERAKRIWRTVISKSGADVVGVWVQKDGNSFPMVLQNHIDDGGRSEMWMSKYDSTGALLLRTNIGFGAPVSLIAMGLAFPEDNRLYVHAMEQTSDPAEVVRNMTNVNTEPQDTWVSLRSEDDDDDGGDDDADAGEGPDPPLTRRLPELHGFLFDFKREFVYFWGDISSGSRADGGDFSIYRMPFTGYTREEVTEKEVTLSFEVTIDKTTEDDLTNEDLRLRDIIANDVDIPIGAIDNPTTKRNSSIWQVAYRMTAVCSRYESVKVNTETVLKSRSTRTRLAAVVAPLGTVGDNAEAVRCSEPIETDAPSEGKDVGGTTPETPETESRSSLIPIVAGSVGGVVVLLSVALLLVVVVRPRRRTVYDLYGNQTEDDEYPPSPEEALAAEDAEILAAIKAHASYGGQGDII